MSRKICFYILIFFEVLLALSMLRSYGLHFEYETLNSVSLLSSQFPQQLFLVWFVFRLMKDKRKVEGILAVFAFHICQLVNYFIIPTSIFKPWLVSPVLTVICLIWLVIMIKKTELPTLLASFKSSSAWQSSVPLLGLGMIAVVWATHYLKITIKDISGIFYLLYPILECASIFLFLTLIIIPTVMFPRAIRTADKSRLYIVAGLFIVSYGSIEQLIVPALILYGVSKIKEE